MKKNLNDRDRLIRFGFALSLFGYSYWQYSWIALGIGLFCLYEAVASWCVLYQILGKSSCNTK